MKSYSTQQEILLFTGTTFSSGQWCGREDADNNKDLTEQERLAEACWNGLLQAMLPELFNQCENPQKLFLWKILEGSSFLELDLGEFPKDKDSMYSIDPYLFLAVKSYS